MIIYCLAALHLLAGNLCLTVLIYKPMGSFKLFLLSNIFIALYDLLSVTVVECTSVRHKDHYDFPGYNTPRPLLQTPQVGDYYHISGTVTGVLTGRDNFQVSVRYTVRYHPGGQPLPPDLPEGWADPHSPELFPRYLTRCSLCEPAPSTAGQ